MNSYRTPRPSPRGSTISDLDVQVPPSPRLLADQWVEILNDAKEVFEADGPLQSFLDIGDIEIADGMHAKAGMLALNARTTDVRATQLLAALPEGNFILRLKFLREKDDDWVLEDQFDPVQTERKKGRGSSRSVGTQSPAFDRN